MDFGAVVAYCKGWYKRSSKLNERWKELAYCIYADGYTIFNKDDVVQWILNRFDKDVEFFKKICNAFSIGWFYREVERYKRIGDFCDDDAVISLFIGLLLDAEVKFFEKIYKPTEKILPLSENGVISVDDMFSDCDEQDLSVFDRKRISEMLIFS